MSARYVYRLAVVYPEGIGWDNPPEAWAPPDWGGRGDDGPSFWWPSTRYYLSRSGATTRANLLRSYGCTVTVERSNAITWAAGSSLTPEEPTP